MLTLWVASGTIAAQGAQAPLPGAGGGLARYPRGVTAVLPKLTAEQERRLDRALEELERTARQARTPRVRRKKLVEAERAAEDAIAAAPPSIAGLVAPIADLSEVAVMLRQIVAGFVDYPAVRAELLSRIEAARSEAQAMRRRYRMRAAAALLLM